MCNSYVLVKCTLHDVLLYALCMWLVLEFVFHGFFIKWIEYFIGHAITLLEHLVHESWNIHHLTALHISARHYWELYNNHLRIKELNVLLVTLDFFGAFSAYGWKNSLIFHSIQSADPEIMNSTVIYKISTSPHNKAGTIQYLSVIYKGPQ